MKRHGFLPRRIISDKPLLRDCKGVRAPGLKHWSHKAFNSAQRQSSAVSEMKTNHEGSPIAGSIATVRLHALRSPQLVYCALPPARRTENSLPSPEAFDAWKIAARLA